MIETPAELSVVQNQTAHFFEGTIPSWLSAVGVGSVSATNASDSGGYATLDTGTGSQGDKAQLQTANGFQPTAYDAIRFSAEVELQDPESTVDFWIEFKDDGNSNYIQYWITKGGDDDDYLTTYITGTEQTRQNVRVIDAERRHQIGVLWYVGREEAHVETDGIIAGKQTTTSELPDATRPYLLNIGLATQNTASTRQARVYSFDVEYLRDMAER